MLLTRQPYYWVECKLAKYGIDYYGLAYYGPRNSVDYSALPMVAIPVDYNKLVVSWTTPSGMWDLMRLSRNPYGFPLTPDDGDVLFEDVNENSRTFFTDNGNIPTEGSFKPGHPYYYTLFVRQEASQTWLPAGNAIGIAVKDFNTLTHMIEGLPAILTSQIPYDSALDQNNSVLTQFLKLFAVNHDLYKSQVENLTARYDVENINGQLIPIFLEQFGSSYEPEVGLRQARIFLRNLPRLYQSKGSKAGIENYVKAFVGYDNEVVMGKNLIYTYDDSSFEDSIGNWSKVGTTPSVILTHHTPESVPTMLPYSEPTASVRFPNRQKGCLAVTFNASGGFSTLGFTLGDYEKSVIPVKQSTSYTISAYVARESGSFSANAAMQFWWVDKNNDIIGTTSAPAPSSVSTSWSRVVFTTVPPVDAVGGLLSVEFSGVTAANKKFFVDAVQFEESNTATDFEDARKIHINLVASRVNELLNPNLKTQ